MSCEFFIFCFGSNFFKILIFYFKTSAVVSAKDIYPYQQYKHQLGIPRKMKNFNEGLEEIEKHPNLTMNSEEMLRLRDERELSGHNNYDDESNLRPNCCLIILHRKKSGTSAYAKTI